MTVKQLWRTKYPESYQEAQKRVMLGAGMKEEEYPVEIRKALYLKYSKHNRFGYK